MSRIPHYRRAQMLALLISGPMSTEQLAAAGRLSRAEAFEVMHEFEEFGRVVYSGGRWYKR